MNSTRFRTIFLCGLALLLAVFGPNVRVTLPRAFSSMPEEEIRHSGSETILSNRTTVLRPAWQRARTLGGRACWNQRIDRRAVVPGQADALVPRSLRSLEIRIDV